MADQSDTQKPTETHSTNSEGQSELQQALETVEATRLALQTISEERLPRVDVDAEWSENDRDHLRKVIESTRVSLDHIELELVEPEQALEKVIEQKQTEEQELPFDCMWEVGVNEAGDPDDWSHYHPLAKSEKEAKRKAQQEAREDGFTDPYPYQAFGPMKPDNPFRVGKEMISQVFGGED